MNEELVRKTLQAIPYFIPFYILFGGIAYLIMGLEFFTAPMLLAFMLSVFIGLCGSGMQEAFKRK